ncbi:MAG: hypothetical protein WEC75_10870 [Dehalococcoidia bacterium]
MVRPWIVLKILIAGVAMVFAALLHHGHIVMFLTEVREGLRRKGAARLRGSRIRQESSRLEVDFGDPAVHYVVAVHRKWRSLEIGLHFEGERADNERRLGLLAERSDAIRRRLGAGVEFETWTKQWTRVHESTVVCSSDDWSPKRDLTPALARSTVTRFLRFVRVLQPLVERERG